MTVSPCTTCAGPSRDDATLSKGHNKYNVRIMFSTLNPEGTSRESASVANEETEEKTQRPMEGSPERAIL